MISMVFYVGGLSSGWSFISGFPSEVVVFKPDGVSSVVFCQGKWSFLNRMVFISGLPSRKVVFQQDGLSSVVVHQGMVFQQDGLLSVVFQHGKWSVNRIVFSQWSSIKGNSPSTGWSFMRVVFHQRFPRKQPIHTR